MARKYGRVALVDLSSVSSRVLEIEDDTLKNFVGGAGLAAHLYRQLVKGNVPPLAPESPFIIMTGPLTGTSIMLSGRHGVAGRSPLTGFWGESSLGGHWGRELRRTGFDGLVVLGKAEHPTYLWIDNGNLHFRNASHIWGLDTFETDRVLKEELNEKIQVCCIGPAGEKLVKFAGVFTDGPHARAAGRCGLGALMGSKNLKAIVVKGDEKIPVLSPDALKESVQEVRKNLTGLMKGMSEFGTPGILTACEAQGDLPIKNWQQGKWENTEKIGGEQLGERFVKKQFFCAGCPVGCGRVVKGVFDPLVEETGGPEYETLAMLGSNCLIEDLGSLIRLNELVNRLGLDSIETGALVAFSMELYEKGLIGRSELGPVELSWGNAEGAEHLIKMIASREGFGDLLADGMKTAAEKIGGMAVEYAVQSNNMALPAHDPRAYSSLALCYNTSSRGPCHTSSFSHIFEWGATFPEIGISEPLDRFESKGKANAFVKIQDVMTLWENLAICKFSFFGGIQLRHVTEWLKQVVGWDFTVQDLLEIGERSVALKRKMNVDWGISRKNDSLPMRILTHRTRDGGAGDHLPPQNVLIADYYDIRGWNKEGIPLEETLRRLGLADIP